MENRTPLAVLLVLLPIASLAVVVGCGRKDPPRPGASEVAAPRAADASAFDPGSKMREAAALTRAWNGAINAHDESALGLLYDDEIDLYGVHVTRARALAMKRAAFASHLRDDLTKLEVGGTRVTFTKRSTPKHGAPIQVSAYLDLVRTDAGPLRIQAEGDTTTDTNLARKKAQACESAVNALVWATKEAKGAEDEIERGTIMAGATVGGMTSPPEGQETTWTVGVCANLPDRMPCPYWFQVDPGTGEVKSDDGSGEAKPIVVEPKLAAEVRSACR